MIKDGYRIENSGENLGVIVGENVGNIVLNMTNVKKIPSLISKLVKVLGATCSTEDDISIVTIPKEFKTEDKIEYNGVIKYKYIIKEYSSYYFTCEDYLNAYDDSNITGKAKILNCIYLWYLGVKGQVLLENRDSNKSEIDIIKINADRIIDMIKEKIVMVVQESKEIDAIYREDLEIGVACFICYCFMKCKILEKPL